MRCQREHGRGPFSVAVLPEVTWFLEAALRALDPVRAAALQRMDGETGVLQQLAEGEFEIVHGSWSVVSEQ